MQIKRFKFFLFAAAFLAAAVSARAQYYMTGSAKAGIKWREMEGRHYRLIYPEEIDSLAQRYMWLLENTRGQVMYGLRDEGRRRGSFRMNVVLHPYTTRSNGTVAWAPKRMELYTRPMADALYPEPWERQLVLHEARHVGQMAPFTKGVFRPLSYIFGEQITGLGVGVYMRRWFLEGDAVVAETELSGSGRGRSASFLEYHRAAAISGDIRSFEHWYFGSNRYYTPDIYPFGYMIVSAGRILSGDYNFSGKLLNGISSEFYNPDVVNRNFRKLTGYSRRHLFYKGFEYYTDYWKKEWRSRGKFSEHLLLAGSGNRYYTEYRSPLAVGKDSVVCVRYSYDKPCALVLVTGPGDQRVLHAFSSSASSLAINGDDLLWTETVPDSRWELGSVQRLMAYGLKSGKIRALSGKESYYNPATAPQTDTVAVVEYPEEGGSNLVFLNGKDYGKCGFAEAPEHGQITAAAYAAGKWYATVITEDGVGIFSLHDGKWTREIAEQQASLSDLRSYGDNLVFVSDIDGVNNIYLYNVKSRCLDRVTNSEFGAADPYVYDGEAYYSSLGLDGRALVKSPLLNNKDNGLTVTFSNDSIRSDYKYEPAEILAEQAKKAFKTDNISSQPDYNGSFARYESKRYRKGTHLFNFHSWMPFYMNVDKIRNSNFDHNYEILSLGATLYSQNLLGTSRAMLGYSYRNGHHAAHASFEYSGWYPVFRVSLDYNEENRYRYTLRQTHGGYSINAEKTDKSLADLTLTAYLPLLFNSRGWYRGMTPQIHYQYSNDDFFSLSRQKYINRRQLVYGVNYYQMRETAAGAVFPRWGFGLTAMGLSPLSGNSDFSSVGEVYGYLYLPGIMACHGIKLGAGYQFHNVKGRVFYSDNLLEMPRGYTSDFYGENYCLFTADYAVPFNLRGLSLGWLAYIRQIRLIPFADIGLVKSSGTSYVCHSSAGCDLVFNTNLFRLGSAVDIGVRYARRFNSGGNYFGMLFNVAIF